MVEELVSQPVNTVDVFWWCLASVLQMLQYPTINKCLSKWDIVRGGFLLPFIADASCLWVHVLYCNGDLFLLQSLPVINICLKLIICNKLNILKMCLHVFRRPHCHIWVFPTAEGIYLYSVLRRTETSSFCSWNQISPCNPGDLGSLLIFFPATTSWFSLLE